MQSKKNRFRPSFKMCTHISENEIYSLDQEPFFIVQKTQKKKIRRLFQEIMNLIRKNRQYNKKS